MDMNSLDLDSNEEVGFSIVTLAEATKGKSVHEKHSFYKKFLLLYGKSNYHIYIPHELDDLKSELETAISLKQKDKQYNILEQMCSSVINMIYIYYSLVICLFVIAILHINHNFYVDGDEIKVKDDNEQRLAVFCNFVVLTFSYIFQSRSVMFFDGYSKWEKEDGNKYGNNLFTFLMKRYYKLLGKSLPQNISLFFDKKNLNGIIANNKKIDVNYLKSLFDLYFKFRINDTLTKTIFIPYLLKVLNDETTLLEFNHIADAFIIFNAITVAKSEEKEIVIDTNDELLKNTFSFVKSTISNPK